MHQAQPKLAVVDDDDIFMIIARKMMGYCAPEWNMMEFTNGEEMLDVLLDASMKLRLGLTREQLRNTPPIRDWVWWKNKNALVTIGD